MLRYIKDTMLHYIKLTPGIRRQSGGLRALLGGGGGSSPPRRPGPQMPINYTTDSLGSFKANGVRVCLFGPIVNLPDQVNIKKKYHFPSRGHSFSSIASTLFEIEQ